MAFTEGALPAADQAAVATHLDTCETCLALVAELAGRRTSGAPATAGSPWTALERGTAIGRYLLLDLVGSGAMADVYAAYDPKLERRVALKLMKARTASSELAARFTREAQAVARLSHPNVVAIHDAGEFDDRIYLAMEFVEGDTVADWLRAAPRSWRQIREVFVAAGCGLAAAHDAGLVHRDFKPQNVMVGRDGIVRVMDFGLARDVSRDDERSATFSDDDDVRPTPSTLALTRTGVLLGTPLYMAPEQFLGRPTDARTDQFSFCVALHEALYEERPFPSESLRVLSEATIGGRAREPRQKARAPAFIRRILTQGLAADPGSRFPSMHALLERLRHDPIRRRRGIAASAALAAIAIAVGAGGQRFATRGERMCRAAADRLAEIWESNDRGARREEIHRAFLSTGRTFAATTWTRVSALLDAYSRRWSETYTDACEATHVRGDQSSEVMDLRMTCLDEARQGLHALTEVFTHADPAVLIKAVDAVHALSPLERCSDVSGLRATVSLAADPATKARVAALRTRLSQVKALVDTGQFPAARQRVTPLLEAVTALGFKPLLAETLATAGWIELESGAPEKADQLLAKSVWAALAGHRDDIAADSAAIIVGVSGYYLGQADDSRRWEPVAESLLQRLGPGHDRTAAWFYQSRASARERQGRYAEALVDQNRALALKESALPKDHPDTGHTLLSIANVQNTLGEHQLALVAATRAVDIFERAYGAGAPPIAQPLGIRGETLTFLGRYAEAERDLRSAVDLSTAWVGAEHPWTAYQLTGLGKVLLAEKRWQEAAAILKHAVRIREASEPNAELVAEARFALAQALWGGGGNQTASKSLAVAARDAYRKLPNRQTEAREVELWLADR